MICDVISFWNRGGRQLYGWNKERRSAKLRRPTLADDFPLPLEEITVGVAQAPAAGGGARHTKRRRNVRSLSRAVVPAARTSADARRNLLETK